MPKDVELLAVLRLMCLAYFHLSLRGSIIINVFGMVIPRMGLGAQQRLTAKESISVDMEIGETVHLNAPSRLTLSRILLYKQLHGERQLE